MGSRSRGGTTGFYSDGSPTGVDHPGGEYSTNIGVLESTTADNGWMIFDCDYYNTNFRGLPEH